MSIETRSCWDTNLFLVYPSEILRELYFWRDNVIALISLQVELCILSKSLNIL
jgi:hypothetical protein